MDVGFWCGRGGIHNLDCWNDQVVGSKDRQKMMLNLLTIVSKG